MYGIYENSKIIAAFVAPLKVISNKPIFVSDALSLKRSTYSRSAQRWEIETNLQPLVETANDLFVNIVTKGKSETVQALMPQNYAVRLKRTATAMITATGTIGSSTVTIIGSNGLIPKGCFVRFFENPKIYMTTSDLTGNGSLSIYPPLRKAAIGGIMAYKDDVIFECFYDTDTITGMVYTDGILMDNGNIKLIEKLT
jgi:hypothetical protein